jgi:hypothetical protein
MLAAAVVVLLFLLVALQQALVALVAVVLVERLHRPVEVEYQALPIQVAVVVVHQQIQTCILAVLAALALLLFPTQINTKTLQQLELM